MSCTAPIVSVGYRLTTLTGELVLVTREGEIPPEIPPITVSVSIEPLTGGLDFCLPEPEPLPTTIVTPLTGTVYAGL
jgi:hypothetical protein